MVGWEERAQLIVEASSVAVLPVEYAVFFLAAFKALDWSSAYLLQLTMLQLQLALGQ